MPENPNPDPDTGSEYFYGANITMTTTNVNTNHLNNNNNNNNRKQPRVTSAGLKYYDIATQLLGKQGSDIEELFIAAARDGVYERIENFLQRNRSEYVISIDVKDKKTGNTPLIWAAKRGHAKIVQLLLRHGADITLRNYEGQTAVEVASPSIRAILLESVERSTEASHQLLLQAAWQGDIKVVSRLLTQKKVLDINCQNADGFTPVMLATRDMLLFERLATQMSRPYNPVEVVSELLSARADLHATDEDGKTCLHHASQSKAQIAPGVVATIITGGPNMECKDKRSFTSVHCASLNGNADCISTLLQGGSDVNARGFAGATPLHITSYNNHEKATDVLLEYGANVTATDDRGLTPLDFAKTRKMKKKLQEAWAEVTNSKSTTSLGPVRALSREDLRSSIEDLTKKRKGEVIFEGLPSNPFSDSKKDSMSRGHGLRRSKSLRELSNLRIVTLLDSWSPLDTSIRYNKGTRGLTRHSSLKDKKSEDENGILLKDSVRKLGQVRNQRPAPLPRGKSRSTERLPAISPDRVSIDRNTESPVPFNRTARSRRSFEDKRQGRRPAPLPSREATSMADDLLDRPTPRHARSDSDPNRGTPNLLDIAASCESYINNGNKRGRSYSVNSNPANTSIPDFTYMQRETTVITPVQREATLMSVCSYRSESRMSTNSTSPRLLNLGQMLVKPKTPVHNFPYGPTSNKVIPPTPTFLTQRQFSIPDGKSEYDHSPRSDDDADVLSELQRSRTIFKEEFVLEESRPKDPFIQSSSSGSGTDTLSSSGSSRFSSPRESQNQSNSKTMTQSKSDKQTNIKVNQSRKNNQTGSKTSQMTLSSKPVILREKSVPTVKAGGSGSNKVGSDEQLQNSVPTSKADTSTLHAMAMRNAAVLNVKTKPSQGAKTGGTITVHKDTKTETNKSAEAKSVLKTDTTKDKTNTEQKGVNSGKPRLTTSTRQVPSEQSSNKISTVPASDKTKTEANVVKDTKNIVTKKKVGSPGQVGRVMQVVPTKLAENIIRTAPKPGKDKVDEQSAIKTVSNKTVKSNSTTAAVKDNVNVNNMKLSTSAEVPTRLANDPQQQNKDNKVTSTETSKGTSASGPDSKIQVVPLKNKTLVPPAVPPRTYKSLVQPASTTGAQDKPTTETKMDQKKPATADGAKSARQPISKQKDSTQTNTSESKEAVRANITNTENKGPANTTANKGSPNTYINKSGNQTSSQSAAIKAGNQGPVQTNVNKSETLPSQNSVPQSGNQPSLVKTNSRPGTQSQNVKASRSAGVNNRQMGNVRKTSSGYTPRFTFINAQKINVNNKSDTNDSKVDSATVQGNNEVKKDGDKSNSTSVNQGSSSSPTELVPPSVCRSASMSKSYNMSGVKSQPSKSTSVTAASKPATSTSASSLSKSTTAVNSTTATMSSASTLGNVSSSTVSKGISPMTAVSTTNKAATIPRSSSMSVIEDNKNNEKKMMSSSDGKIHGNASTQRRPLSDGSVVTDHANKAKNPPLVEILPDCAPRVNARNYIESNAKLETPVIVNPFAELEQRREEEIHKVGGQFVSASEFGFTIDKPSVERSKTQGTMKAKNKNIKKPTSKDTKPSSANSRVSSGRRKKVKSKDGNKSDTESRPRSGKTGKRIKSGKRKRKIPEGNLATENEKSDVALIGGIGWQLATSCIDKSEADAVVVTQIDSSESESEDVSVIGLKSELRLQIPSATHMQLPNSLETPTSLSSPRFKEVRPNPHERPNLPCMENDGYPPMNLDMTQNSLSQQNRSGVIVDNNIPDDISEFLAKLKNEEDPVFDDEDDGDDDDDTDYDADDLEHFDTSLYTQLQRDVLAGKLTPIPESPAQTNNSVSSLRHMSKTVDAIMKFDQNVQEDDLNKLLGLTPRDKLPDSAKSEKFSSIRSKPSSVRDSSGSSRSSQIRNISTSAQSTRSQESRMTGSRSNQAKSAMVKGEGKDRQEAVPKPKLSHSAPLTKANQQKGNSRESSRRSSRNSGKYEVSQDSTQQIAKDKVVDKTDNKGEKASVDLKKLLTEKMQSTVKMLEEANSLSREARSAGQRQFNVGNGKDVREEMETNKEVKASVEEGNIKLDIRELSSLNVERKEDDLKSNRSSRRERKFSETKVVSPDREDDIDEAIDEIMSNTFPSRSTMRSYRTGSSTLTEADRNVLMKMSQAQQQSPFYAKDPESEREAKQSARASTTYDDTTLNKANPDLLKRFHADDFEMGRKVKAMIDAGADTAKVKAMLQADGRNAHSKDIANSESEVKQLVKIMHSFKQMELYAGPSLLNQRSSKKETPRREGEFKSLSRFDNYSNPTGLPPRPGSAGAGRHRKEKFTEIKEASGPASGKQPHTASAVPKDLAEEFKRSPYVQVEGSYQGAQSVVRAGSPSSETLDEDSMERPDSACTTLSSNSSVMEETIQWKKGNVLGKGAFGTVWCGLTSEGHLIAVKQIELNVTNQTKAKKEYEKVQEEVELLKTLEHKNIVGYLGTSLEDSIVSIFMQFVPGGSIASILARFGALDESVFRKYTRQILEGVEYLHSNDVIHRDIKGGNVMLMPNGVIKLIDFGCAKRLCINLSMGQSEILKSMKGTPYWMAPEVVNETGHGKKSDIWSIGCTVFEMATRKPPWADMNPMAAIFAIGCDRPVPQLPDKFSEEARDFVNYCLNRDQTKRMSASELLQTSFIRRRTKRSTTSIS